MIKSKDFRPTHSKTDEKIASANTSSFQLSAWSIQNFASIKFMKQQIASINFMKYIEILFPSCFNELYLYGKWEWTGIYFEVRHLNFKQLFREFFYVLC